eukprot:1153723-Amphidinium_carterae.1
MQLHSDLGLASTASCTCISFGWYWTWSAGRIVTQSSCQSNSIDGASWGEVAAHVAVHDSPLCWFGVSTIGGTGKTQRPGIGKSFGEAKTEGEGKGDDVGQAVEIKSRIAPKMQ